MLSLSLLRLHRELNLWARAGRTPLMWWRDDDAREATPALEKLLAVRGDLPIALAIIPDGDMEDIGDWLGAAPRLTVAQHGVDHENRLPAGGDGGLTRSEYPPGTPQEAVTKSVCDARWRMETAGLKPAFYTPPWNEFDERLITALKAAGYGAFSAGIYGKPMGGLDHIGAEIDILRWKGAPRFRGRGRIFTALRRQLERRRKAGAWAEPVGLLTHHLVHDDAAWEFLAWFTPFSRRRFAWRSFGELEAARSPA